MAEFNLVISDKKTGKSYKKSVAGIDAQKFIGLKLGDTLKADFLEMPGYELEIMGGSDKQGFPMRHDIEGMGRKRILLSGGVGFKPVEKGERRRKSVCGKIVSENISQINLAIKTYGQKPLEEIFKVEPKKEEAK